MAGEKKIKDILTDEEIEKYDIRPASKVKELTLDDVNNLSQVMMEAVRTKKPTGGGCAMCCCAMCCCAAATRAI
jgi:hypothetical protein